MQEHMHEAKERAAMTADQLRECREAFLREMGAMFGEISIMAFRQGHMPSGMGMAWTAWEKCWNARPTAVASHAEGEVELLTMAYRAGFIGACQWPEPVSHDVDSPAFKAELQSFIEKHTPLYTHPPRSGDEAISVDYRAACCGRKECGGECGNEWRGNEPYIPESSLCALLPDSYYMDPPDGGDVNVYEQLRRMAKDAARYRWLRDPYNEGERLVDRFGKDELDQAIDAAMAARGGE